MPTLIRTPRFHDRSGGALIASLVVVTLVASLGAGLIRIQTSITRRHVHSIDQKRALYIAEAGIAEAFAAVAVGKSGFVGKPEEPAAFAGGVYWVEAEEDGLGRVTLDSTGLCGSGRFSVSVVIQRDVNPAALNGVFGGKDVQIGAGAIVDGFSSQLGSFQSQLDPALPTSSTGAGAKVSSNSDVNVDGDVLLSGGPGTLVYGDVRPGPEGIVTVDPSATITGATTPLTAPVELPPVSIPDVDDIQTTLGVSGGSTITVGDTEVSYESVSVTVGSTLALEGPLKLVVEEFTLSGTLSIDATDGPVTIYVTESLDFTQSSTLYSVDQQATQVGLFLAELGMNPGDLEYAASEGVTKALSYVVVEEGPGGIGMVAPNPTFEAPPVRDSLVFESSGEFYGLIYAPFSDVTIPTGLRMFGAVAARRVELEDDVRFTYDMSLAMTGVGIETLPRILSWRVDELPDDPIVKSRADPFVTMTLAGITPVSSSVAHKEFNVSMKYVDNAGVQQMFVGDVKTFDWTTCKSVTSVSWENPDTLVYTTPKVPPGSYSGDTYTNTDPTSVFAN